MLEDMAVRKFADKTRHDYFRHVETFTAFLGRSRAARTGTRCSHPSCRSCCARGGCSVARRLAVPRRLMPNPVRGTPVELQEDSGLLAPRSGAAQRGYRLGGPLRNAAGAKAMPRGCPRWRRRLLRQTPVRSWCRSGMSAPRRPRVRRAQPPRDRPHRRRAPLRWCADPRHGRRPDEARQMW
jgi:hypothetical protein